MHSHHADMFDAIEFGARFEVRMKNVGATGGKTHTPTAAELKKQQDAANKAEYDRLKSKADSEKANATSKQKVDSAAKDGHVNIKEKNTVTNSSGLDDAKKAVKENQERLKKSIKESKGESTSYATGYGSTSVNDHDARIKKLKDAKAKGVDLDSMERRAKELDSKDPSAAKAMREQIAARKAEEDKVVAETKQMTELRGNNEVEAAQIENDRSTSDAEVTAKYKSRAADAMRRFNEANGKVDNSDNGEDGIWRDDDWKTPDKDATFEELSDRFKKYPKRLEEFASGQGNGDIGGMTDEEFANHVKTIRDDGERANAIARHQAAKELQGIIKDYNAERNAREAGSKRLDEIKTENEQLDKDIASNREALSESTKYQMDKENGQTVDYSDPSDSSSGSVSGGGGTSTNTETSSKSNDTSTSTTTKTVAIDYSKGAAHKTLVAKARKAGLIDEHVSFNKDGQAVYKVQRGDGFWRIAQRTDGNKGSGLDGNYFQKLVATNVKRLNIRDANQIEIGQKMVLPGRSYDDLIKLLKLPLTRTEKVESEKNDQPAGGSGARRKAV